MTRNIKGLLQALQQSINEAILESNDVAAAMAALKRTGKCPVFTIDISMQDPSGADSETEPADGEELETLECDLSGRMANAPRPLPERSGPPEELVLTDQDVEFLASLGVCDPSWANTSYQLPKD